MDVDIMMQARRRRARSSRGSMWTAPPVRQTDYVVPKHDGTVLLVSVKENTK